MTRDLCLAMALLASATVSSAQSMGTLTENGVAMEVKAAVGLLKTDGPSLEFYLLPFQPTAAEIAKLQADDYFWVLDKPSPDAKKWKTCPFGKFRLNWTGVAGQGIGDAKKASVYVLGNGIASEGNATNISKLPAEVDASLVGSVKEGQEVTLTSKGSDTTGSTTLAWDLKLKTRVLALKGS
jgi:hypothetical protein